ncbi:hypothetical protein [Massilia rubra]|uniref:hypothetical protein n=1 Tax=Massilia rubra TaxID=2607910 RepID=UPI00165203FE
MLINCLACQDGKKLSDIPAADVSEFIVLPDEFVWVALNDAGQAEPWINFCRQWHIVIQAEQRRQT